MLFVETRASLGAWHLWFRPTPIGSYNWLSVLIRGLELSFLGPEGSGSFGGWVRAVGRGVVFASYTFFTKAARRS